MGHARKRDSDIGIREIKELDLKKASVKPLVAVGKRDRKWSGE